MLNVLYSVFHLLITITQRGRYWSYSPFVFERVLDWSPGCVTSGSRSSTANCFSVSGSQSQRSACWYHGAIATEKEVVVINFLPIFIFPFAHVTYCLVGLCLPRSKTTFPRLLRGWYSYMSKFLPLDYKQKYPKEASGTFPGKAAATCLCHPHPPF